MTERDQRSVRHTAGMTDLLVMSALAFAGFAVLLPTAPLWATHQGAGTTGAGLVNAVLMLSTVLTQPVVPTLLRRLGWARTLAAGLVLLGGPSLLHPLATELAPQLVLAAVRGLGFGILTVCGASAVASLVEPARRGRAIGAYGLAIAAPQLVLIPIGPWLAGQVGYWAVFLLGAFPVLGVPFAVRVATHLSRPAEPTNSIEPERHSPATCVALLRPTIILLGITTVGGALLTFAPQMVTEPTTAMSLLLFTTAAALTRWRVGHYADRFGTQPFTAPLIALSVVGTAIVAWAVAGTPRSWAFLLGMALVGLCYGAMQNLTLIDAFATVRPRDQHTASAVWNMGFDGGTGLGSMLVGLLAAGAGFSRALLCTAALSALTLALAIRPCR